MQIDWVFSVMGSTAESAGAVALSAGARISVGIPKQELSLNSRWFRQERAGSSQITSGRGETIYRLQVTSFLYPGAGPGLWIIQESLNNVMDGMCTLLKVIVVTR